MHKRLLTVVLAVAAGIGIGAFAVSRLGSDNASAEVSSRHKVADFIEQVAQGDLRESDPEQVARVVESLAQILNEEIAERRILAEQLEELRSEVTDLQENLGTRVAEAFSNGAVGSVSIAVEGTAPPQDNFQRNLAMEARLAAAGFTAEQVATLRRREAEMLMQQVELDDRARREGWVNTPRYFEEFNNLSNDQNPIRRELGDDAYDRYLFASGRPNRVAVANVIETSAAERVGLREGDVILSYGGERLFETGQLINLRSAGVRGEPVNLEIIRDGQFMRITMPRGAMGINTQPEVMDPGVPPGR